jgi:alkylation response protein AidB-like acyl-CoA dehydrogenase
MHPAPTKEQQELMEAVERFCQEQIAPERLAAWEKEPRGIDERSWRSIAELGWFGIGVPEGAGGSGLALVEVACLLHECGRGLIPRSVIAAVRGAWALGRLDPGAAELADVAAGRRTVTLALDEESARDPERYGTRVDGEGSAACVSGEKWYVPDGLNADLQIVAARDGRGVSLLLVARDRTSPSGLRSFDGEPQARVRYERAPVLRRLVEPALGLGATVVLRREQSALALAEMVGGMKAALDMTVAYVKEREQFGQKIAVFQAVQHQVADMATAYTAARHLAWQATVRLAAGTAQGVDLETAAAFVGRAFKQVTLTAHHLHGGAGFVVEHPLHYHAERAQALCIRYTPEAAALAAVAASLLD